MLTLTAQQAALLRYIAGYQEAHGFSPSVREMAAGTGTKSVNNIVRMLDCLEERRAIRRMCQRARSVQILVPVSLPRAPDGAPLRAVLIGGAAWA